MVSLKKGNIYYSGSNTLKNFEFIKIFYIHNVHITKKLYNSPYKSHKNTTNIKITQLSNPLPFSIIKISKKGGVFL